MTPTGTRKRLSRRGFLATTAAATAAAAGGGWVWAASGHDTIDEYLADVLPADASLTVAAFAGGKTVYRKGFGLADRKAKIGCDFSTGYDIGSLTKQFTAAAVLRLELDGALKVSDPLSRHLSGLPSDKRDITLHQLLTHTAGLKDLAGLGDYDPVDRDRLLREFGDRDLAWKPGERHHYTNLGYSLLAAVIELATSGGYEAYLAEHLFAPAGMNHTGYLLPDWAPGTIAEQYDQKGRARGKPNELDWDDDGPYWILRGNGGLLSTAADIVAWHRALSREKILSRQAKAKLFEPHVAEDASGDTYYGYGWVIEPAGDGGRLAWHDGSNGWSFSLLARHLDDGRMVFWSTNAADWDGGDSLEHVLSILDLLRR